MFQFIRRVSGSFLPRPDRPWRDDATSHAPTIGRKRRHSVTEQESDRSASPTVKRSKNESVKPDTECDSTSRGESPKGDPILLAEGQDVKEVTKGVKKVDLEDRDKSVDTSSVPPEGIPLPDSPSRSPESEAELEEPVEDSCQSNEIEEPTDEERADDKDSLASSAPGDAETGTNDELVTTTIMNAQADEIVPAQEIAAAESGLYDTPDILEVKA